MDQFIAESYDGKATLARMRMHLSDFATHELWFSELEIGSPSTANQLAQHSVE